MDDPKPSQRVRRVVVRVAAWTGVVMLAVQAVPYGWRHSNPPVTSAAVWPDDASARLARAACYDCHSHETKWPPYSYVAPMSWLVRRDVDAGRDELNFSEWDVDDAEDAAESIADRSMPPGRYTVLHPDAKLSAAEREQLLEALEAMGGEADEGAEEDEDEDDSGRGRGRGRGRSGSG